MLESAYIYILVALILFCGGKCSTYMRYSTSIAEQRAYLLPLLISCVLYAVIFGARYNVGIDYLAYLDSYINIACGNRSEPEGEVAWYYINYFLGHNGFHYFYFFFLIALIQITFLLIGFKDKIYLVPYIGLILMTGSFLTMMNGIRQYTVFSIVIWLIATFKKRKALEYFICIFFCTFIHTSAIIFLPIYFYLKKPINLTGSRMLQLPIFISFVAASYLGLFTEQLEWTKIVAEAIGYDKYSTINMASQINASYSWGFRTLIYIGMIFMTIFFSKYTKRFFKNSQYEVFYTFYFWGSCFAVLFLNNNAVRRVFDYFALMSIVVYGCTLYYLSKKKYKNKIDFFRYLAYVIGIALTFVGTLYAGTIPTDCASFHFFFEN